MRGDYAREYFLWRARQRVEARPQRQEWDYLARVLLDHEVVDDVGHGWRRRCSRSATARKEE